MDKLNEDEEFMLEKSLEKSVLSFLRLSLLTVDDFHSEELSIRRFHSLIAGVILHFPLKVNFFPIFFLLKYCQTISFQIKELRTQTDEELRYEEQQEQNGMGATGRFQFHFEQLLLLVSFSCH